MTAFGKWLKHEALAAFVALFIAFITVPLFALILGISAGTMWVIFDSHGYPTNSDRFWSASILLTFVISLLMTWYVPRRWP